MEKKIMTVLTPDFYNEFHCVAGDCRHNCCVHPWGIYINKKNYKQLRALREPKWLTENLSSYIKRNDRSKSIHDYAYAVYNERGCALQTEDGLCRLQKDLGAEYLSDTCTHYPRIDSYYISNQSNNIGMFKERYLTISCEEVVRILLHKPEPIQFVTSEEKYNPANLNSECRHLNNNITDDGTRPILGHYSIIRAVCIAVLQNRDYTIEERLILLVVYLDKLIQAEADNDTDSIPAITDTFVSAVDERLYDKLFAATPIPSVTALLTNFAAIYALKSGVGHEIVTRCDKGFTSVDYSLRVKSYREFMGDKEYFLEHLLVSELFGKALPFTSRRSISDCMQYLVSIFTIFRFMLEGYLGDQSTLTEVEFIDFVAYFGKKVLHSPGSFSQNIELLKINNMNTLAYMIALIIG